MTTINDIKQRLAEAQLELSAYMEVSCAHTLCDTCRQVQIQNIKNRDSLIQEIVSLEKELQQHDEGL